MRDRVSPLASRWWRAALALVVAVAYKLRYAWNVHQLAQLNSESHEA